MIRIFNEKQKFVLGSCIKIRRLRVPMKDFMMQEVFTYRTGAEQLDYNVIAKHIVQQFEGNL